MTVTVQVTTNPITVLPVSTVTDATYVFVLADRLKVVKGNRGTAQTFTIPADATTDFPDGTILTVCQAGDGQISIANADGVTVNATPGLKLRAKYSAVQLWKETTNVWWAWGDLSA